VRSLGFRGRFHAAGLAEVGPDRRKAPIVGVREV
jgi:hypothetical protein